MGNNFTIKTEIATIDSVLFDHPLGCGMVSKIRPINIQTSLEHYVHNDQYSVTNFYKKLVFCSNFNVLD